MRPPLENAVSAEAGGKALSDQDAIDLIRALIAIPSVSSEEDKIATYLVERLGGVFPGAVTRTGNNVLVTLGDPRATHRLLLCSHIDTVSPAAGWTRDPFVPDIIDGKIYGLGANDALGALVSMITAASRRQHQVEGNVGLTLALVAEEEMGEKGFYTIAPSLDYSCAIFGEPTDLQIGVTMRGYMRLELRGEGKACHASRPWEGENAVTDLARQLVALDDIRVALKDNSPWGGATIEPTIIKGGSSANQIPDAATAVLDVRPTATMDNERILAMLQKRGCKCTIIHNRRRPMDCDMDSEVFKAVMAAHPAAITYGFGGTCDMAFATKPSVVIGPGKSPRSHAADEYIELRELVAGIDFMDRILDVYVNTYARAAR